jgi:haloacetate dehalogenase
MHIEQLFQGFSEGVAQVSGVEIPYITAGTGPSVLLLHGFPQNKAIWHRVAGALARRFTVVISDLRGYGDASKPEGLPDHSTYSKREMALDQLKLMRSLGHDAFSVVGHDRGGRVAHRLATDHPNAITKLMTLDICPTLAMYEQTSMAFATAYWHWFFLIQPAPLPERLINADPLFFLTQFIGNRSAGLAPFAPEAWLEYVRCMRNPACVHAMCEDYRAAATIDLAHDRADRAAGRNIACPVRVLWGKHGVIERCFKPLEEWRKVADTVAGHGLECGHYMPEEVPGALISEIETFFSTGDSEMRR